MEKKTEECLSITTLIDDLRTELERNKSLGHSTVPITNVIDITVFTAGALGPNPQMKLNFHIKGQAEKEELEAKVSNLENELADIKASREYKIGCRLMDSVRSDLNRYFNCSSEELKNRLSGKDGEQFIDKMALIVAALL